MTLRKRILVSVLVVAALALASLAFAVSRDASCPPASSTSDAGGTQMRAIVQRCYGTPDVLRLESIARPVPGDDEVRVKVRAASVNPLDWHGLTGKPYVMRLSSGFGAPDDSRVGVDFAGTVDAVGKHVRRFKPGDDVFGGRSGALAEYVVVREDGALVGKPANASFEQAATLGVAAITALQGLRDKGQLRAGQKVLVNGASGGVGTFAVQIAKAYGAEVTGVCSTRNVDLVRSTGADHVIDYTRADFTHGSERYDLILDNVGNHGLLDARRALKRGGRLVIVSGPKQDPWLGPVTRMLKAYVLSPFVDEPLVSFIAQMNRDDLAHLAELVQAGKVTPVIDRRYPLVQAAEAIGYQGSGRARGKVIVTVE